MNIKKLTLTTLFTASLLFMLSAAIAKEDQTSWLFVQTAADFTSDGDTLTIPYEREIFAFTDRPNRQHAYLNATELTSLWNTGEDNFGENPPNAVLTWVADGEVHEAEIKMMAASVSEDGRAITYNIQFESDQPIPNTAERVSLFIDGYIRFGCTPKDGKCIG